MTAPVIRNDVSCDAGVTLSPLDGLRRRLVALRVRLEGAKTDFQRGQADGVEAALAVLHEVQVGLPLGASAPVDVPMSLVPTAHLEYTRVALEAALALIAKRPANDPRPALGERMRALVAREPGRPCCVGAVRAEALPPDVVGRPRVPGPTL